ncbi:conserved hypothetical protein, partial [Ricinus communis]
MAARLAAGTGRARRARTSLLRQPVPDGPVAEPARRPGRLRRAGRAGRPHQRLPRKPPPAAGRAARAGPDHGGAAGRRLLHLREHRPPDRRQPGVLPAAAAGHRHRQRARHRLRSRRRQALHPFQLRRLHGGNRRSHPPHDTLVRGPTPKGLTMRLAPPLRHAALAAVVMLGGCASTASPPAAPPGLDAEIQRLMAAARVPGLQLALIRDGKVSYTHAYGYANVEKQQPMRTDTIMYAASLTKAVFAYTVMQLVDEGVLTLDAPLPALLDKPLPDYPKFADLKDDPRWRLLTPRMLLSHTSGLLNWRYINENNKLDFKFEPGSRYVYSGEGLNILQIVVEERTG